MKKFKLLTAVALAGLLGLSARAALPANFSSVNFKLTVLIQAASTGSGTTTKFNVTKLKITNKEVLNQVTNEFGAFPAGAQLVLAGNGFFGGTFSVLAKDGTVLLDNASSSGDSYELTISDPNNYIYTGSETATTAKYNITTGGDFYWQDATASNFLEIVGPATVTDTIGASNGPESFKFSGLGDGFLTGNNAIVTGSVNGAGKNTASF